MRMNVRVVVVYSVDVVGDGVDDIDSRLVELWKTIHGMTGCEPGKIHVVGDRCFCEELVTFTRYDGDLYVPPETFLQKISDDTCMRIRPLVEEYSRLARLKKNIEKTVVEALDEYIMRANKPAVINRHGYTITIRRTSHKIRVPMQ